MADKAPAVSGAFFINNYDGDGDFVVSDAEKAAAKRLLAEAKVDLSAPLDLDTVERIRAQNPAAAKKLGDALWHVAEYRSVRLPAAKPGDEVGFTKNAIALAMDLSRTADESAAARARLVTLLARRPDMLSQLLPED